jgi:transcriptional regulator with XRE-family HTH domain
MDGLGERLKARIRTLGLTDAEVARRAGLSETRFAHYVRDRREPDYTTFVRICRLLSTTPDALLAFGEASDADEMAALRDRLVAVAQTMDEPMLRTAVEVVTTLARRPG